ncbi:winged helix-turn-helix transcriptional regulator [Pseudonocardia acaciae]|uniref:winged helix-turn-helix transcriptional regulator n=1 Tax=Pseudonocardia acaciae TaxID=551276 RepID=UPI0004906145|nr:helix-turn-helix domain-containing protein [Pseudonocardia acaciae]
MLGRTYEGQNCSAARALEVVGERWTLLLLRDSLLRGLTRFGEFQASLGVAKNVLSARLDLLVREGLLTRRRYSEHPDHHEYLPTEKGYDLLPAIVALTRWGDRWAAPNGPPAVFTHAACDNEITQALYCPSCGRPLAAHEVRPKPGPGFARADP